jgi:multiple sugar transport system permease protein
MASGNHEIFQELPEVRKFFFIQNLFGQKIRNRISTSLAYGILLIAAVLVIFPLVWVVLTSIKQANLAYQIPPAWFFTPTLENYQQIFRDTNFAKYFLNSSIIAFVTTFFAILFGSFAAYSISRFGTGGNFFKGWILNNRTMPPIAMLIPIFLLANFFKLYDTYLTLIIPYLSFILPFSIWMIITYFNVIPQEIEEAALVDGATHFQALLKINIPIAAPGIAATGILCFLFSWNEFLMALILTGIKTRTLPIAVASYLTQRGVMYGGLCAAITLMIIPVILLAFSIRGYLVKGLSAGAIK